MKIKVRLSDAGLRDAERQIQEYKTTLNKKAQEFAKALADKGLDVAKVRFANMPVTTMSLAVLSKTGTPAPSLQRARQLPLSSLALAHITTDMVANYRLVLVHMAPTVKARVLADVGTTTVTPVMPEPMWILFPARGS